METATTVCIYLYMYIYNYVYEKEPANARAFLRRRRRLGVLVTAGRKKMKAIWDAEAGVTGTRSFITRRKQVFLKKKKR